MDGKIGAVREALEEARDDFKTLAHSHDGDFDEAGLRNFGSICERQMGEAIAALSAIDPDAIRRECAEIVDQLAYEFGLSNQQRGMIERAILSTEPAQDDGRLRFRCRDCNSEFDESVMEYYCDDEDGEGDYIGECPVCGSRNLAEAKRRIEEAKE